MHVFCLPHHDTDIFMLIGCKFCRLCDTAEQVAEPRLTICCTLTRCHHLENRYGVDIS